MQLLVGLILGVALGAAVTWWTLRSTAAEPHGHSAHKLTPKPEGAAQSLLSAIELGVIAFDSAGEEVFRNAAAQFGGMSRPTQAVVNGDVKDLVAAMRLRPQSGPSEREIVLYGPPRINLLARALPTVVGGDRGYVVIVDDVTDERRTQDIRRSFVANVSHELRTPVGAIAVLAETLGTTDDPETVARLSDRLGNAAMRLADMIEDLLELSRTESGDLVNAKEVSLAEIVDQVIGNLAEPAQGAEVSVTASITPDDLTVNADRHQLRSALQNLLDNAIKYSEPGGEIRIGAEIKGERISISVADQGIGIPEADLDRIFERFYRVDAARRRETGGTGLGLSIVRHVALNHGGEVSAISVEGDGSTFTIELPLSLADHASPIGDAGANV